MAEGEPQEPEQEVPSGTEGEGLRRRGAAATAQTQDQPGDSAAQDADAGAAAAPSAPHACADDNCKHKQSSWKDMCRRMMLSKVFKSITFTICAIVPVYGTCVALPTILAQLEWNSLFIYYLHVAFAVWVSTQFLFNFGMAQHTNPGSTEEIKPVYEATGQFRLDLTPLGEDTEPLTIKYAPNFCDHCKQWKPPRCHHCSICKRCVLRMDHHCPFTGNCIGFRNHGHFFLMYVFANLGIIYSTLMCLNVVATEWWSGHGPARYSAWRRDYIRQSPFLTRALEFYVLKGLAYLVALVGTPIAIHTFATVLALLATMGCGCPALQFAAGGITMIEYRFPMKEYVEIKPQIYCPLGTGFYQQTWRQNLMAILGPQWKWRLAVPIRGPLDLWGAGICPPASDLGDEALKKMITQVEDQGVQRTVESASELGINMGPGRHETAAAETPTSKNAEDVAEASEAVAA